MTNHWIITAHGADQPITGTAALLGTMPTIEVIAHSLAQLNRFTGHATRPYSVAEHSLLVCDIVAGMGLGPAAQRAALMHDAHESLCGDVASPIKWELGIAWIEFENPLAMLMRKHYGLNATHTGYRAHIKQADLIALATERRDLTRFDPATSAPWPILDTPGAQVLPLDTVDLNSAVRGAMTWRHHRDAFLERYHNLQARINFTPTNLTPPIEATP